MEAKRILKATTDENTERRFEILKVAAQIFYEKGFNATSVNDIADAMNLTKAGLYHYIESKQQLLFEIMSLGLEALERDVIIPAKTGTDAEARLKLIIYYHAKQIAGGNHAVTIISDEVKALSEIQREEITVRRRAYFNFVRNTLDELKAEGKLSDVDTTVATYSMVGMILWVSRWYQPGGELTPDDVSREVSKIALNALLQPSVLAERNDFKIA